MNDPNVPFEECYFHRQPETAEEVEQAISAILVSEMDALRYAGNDPAIIEKLRTRGAADKCDQTPEGYACLRQRARLGDAPPGRWWHRNFWRWLFRG